MYYHVWIPGEGGKNFGSVQKILVVGVPGRPVGGELPPLTITSIADDHRCGVVIGQLPVNNHLVPTIWHVYVSHKVVLFDVIQNVSKRPMLKITLVIFV